MKSYCIFFSLVVLCLSASCSKQSSTLDSFILEKMEEGHLPGLAAAVVANGEVVWVGTYGQANLAESKPVTDSTLFQIASVCKPITATALMQLHAQSLFELDDDINKYLPFEVRNPNFPQEPITFRHLLRHRSSIRDNRDFYAPFWGHHEDHQAPPLGQYLRDYLTLKGKDYDPERNFYHARPNVERHYSSTGYALLAYLAEVISGQPFDEFARTALFEPLGIGKAIWGSTANDTDISAQHYHYEFGVGYKTCTHYTIPHWPAGQLRIGVRDLAKFLSAYSQYGKLEGRAVLDSTSIALLTPPDASLGFHTWSLLALTFKKEYSELIYFHSGRDEGARSFIGFNPVSKIGFIVLTNGDGAAGIIAQTIYKEIPKLVAKKPEGLEKGNNLRHK